MFEPANAKCRLEGRERSKYTVAKRGNIHRYKMWIFNVYFDSFGDVLMTGTRMENQSQDM